ncbi:MAG: hypothetical protein J6B68_11015 [Lachnospiraceae bacterium]|nr:hypothetical protein [Lachnospiraceae bacterium]
MDKTKRGIAVQPPEDIAIDASVEHVKELEDKLLKLRIENAFFKRTEDTAFRGCSKNERTARIIHSLRRQFKLKDLLSYTGMPNATYMYWQKRFDRENPCKELDEKSRRFKKLIKIVMKRNAKFMQIINFKMKYTNSKKK